MVVATPRLLYYADMRSILMDRCAFTTGLAHTSDIYPTFATMAGLSPADIANTGPYPVDGFDLTAALWGTTDAGVAACANGGPRCEVLHQPLNQYWNGSCSAGDLANAFQPSCGAALTVWSVVHPTHHQLKMENGVGKPRCADMGSLFTI